MGVRASPAKTELWSVWSESHRLKLCQLYSEHHFGSNDVQLTKERKRKSCGIFFWACWWVGKDDQKMITLHEQIVTVKLWNLKCTQVPRIWQHNLAVTKAGKLWASQCGRRSTLSALWRAYSRIQRASTSYCLFYVKRSLYPICSSCQLIARRLCEEAWLQESRLITRELFNGFLKFTVESVCQLL